MVKGLTPIYVFRFSSAGGQGFPLSHNEYSQDAEGCWWGRAFKWRHLGYRWVTELVSPGWQQLDEGWELPAECVPTRRRARLPKRETLELRAEADRMLDECLKRRVR